MFYQVTNLSISNVVHKVVSGRRLEKRLALKIRQRNNEEMVLMKILESDDATVLIFYSQNTTDAHSWGIKNKALFLTM